MNGRLPLLTCAMLLAALALGGCTVQSPKTPEYSVSMTATEPGVYPLANNRVRVIGMLERMPENEQTPYGIRLARPIDSYLGELVAISNPDAIEPIPDEYVYVAVTGELRESGGEFASWIEADEIEQVDWTAGLPEPAE